MTVRSFLRSLVLLALCGALAGCVLREEKAEVTFRWDLVSGNRVLSCGEAGVAVLDVMMGSYDEELWYDAFSVPCEWGAVTFDGVEPGRYFVEITNAYWSDRSRWLAADDLRVASGGHHEFDLQLTQ